MSYPTVRLVNKLSRLLESDERDVDRLLLLIQKSRSTEFKVSRSIQQASAPAQRPISEATADQAGTWQLSGNRYV
jgi:hypothetical protein